MNQGIRRLLSLVVVFLAAFLIVTWLRGGAEGFRSLWPFGETTERFRPEQYTLPEQPPLDLEDVALLQRLDAEYAKLTDAVVDSVVSIDTSGVRAQRGFDRFGRQFVWREPTKGQGSGVIVTSEGHVVTNEHVIRGQQQIQVTMSDGQMFPATKIGVDPLLDVAVLKIEADGPFEPLKFGDSSQVRRGQIVFAVGNPFGLGETVTQGIISAVERSLSDTQRDFFQTDTAINPGNSGGPLVNVRGEVIGINSSIYRPDERIESGFQGVGFSIPSNDVRQTLQTILERGKPVRGYLGLRLEPNPRIKNLLGYRGPGVVVYSVSDESPARRAGLQPGDVIVRFDGEEIESERQFINLVQRAAVGESATLEVWRDGETLKLEAEIVETPPPGDLPTEEPQAQRPDAEQSAFLEQIGLRVRDADRRDPGAALGGAVITGIRHGTRPIMALRGGDHIVSINGQRCIDSNGLASVLREELGDEPAEALVIRRNIPLQVILRP